MFLGRVRDSAHPFIRFPHSEFKPYNRGTPSAAEQRWHQTVVRHWIDAGRPFSTFPLILASGHSPWRGPSPAILAVDKHTGQLLTVEQIEPIEKRMTQLLLDDTSPKEDKDVFLASIALAWKQPGEQSWSTAYQTGTQPETFFDVGTIYNEEYEHVGDTVLLAGFREGDEMQVPGPNLDERPRPVQRVTRRGRRRRRGGGPAGGAPQAAR